MDIFVSLGTSQAYQNEAQSTYFSSVSVAFTRPISSVQVHVADMSHFIAAIGTYVGFTKISPTPPRFPTGRIATITFAEAGALIDYTSDQTTLEVLPSLPAVRFDTHAVVLLTGHGTSRDVRVYSPDLSKRITALTLGFSQPLSSYVSAPGTFQTDGGVTVSSYTNVDLRQISFGCFHAPDFTMPTETLITKVDASTLPLEPIEDAFNLLLILLSFHPYPYIPRPPLFLAACVHIVPRYGQVRYIDLQPRGIRL